MFELDMKSLCTSSVDAQEKHAMEKKLSFTK